MVRSGIVTAPGAPDPREALIERLARNPRLLHATLFPHRHGDETPAFHLEMIDDWWSEEPHVGEEAFRGGGKSTVAEEAICGMACLRQFKNAIILGDNETRAKERLTSIKHEFETNEAIQELFGNLVGETWTETKIVLTNGTVLQAYGRGQSLRGAKHLSQRPDMAFGDDMESEDDILTPEAREKFKQWFLKVVMPSLTPRHRFRIAGTPLHPQSWLVRLKSMAGWKFKSYPIKYRGKDGEWVATWPARFPLAEIDKIEQGYIDAGATQEFAQEYMVQSEDPAIKAFKPEMFKVEPTVRTWHPTYAFYDPARTVKTTSATTGVVIFSWIGNRLVVWDGYGPKWLPDQIIADMFKVDEQYSPVTIGVERDGLEQFILQPLRQEQVRRGYAIPIRPLKAPKGKLDFIRSLQPFFGAGEVIFARELPQLQSQFLGFPTGAIDIPNALAYALVLRPGQPIFDGFSYLNVVEEIFKLSRQPMYLAVNATQMYTTAVLVQVNDGVFNVLWDAVREGDPGAVLAGIVTDAGLEAGQKPRLYGAPGHFGNYDTVGLRGAARKIPVDLSQGGAGLDGRDEIRALLRRQVRAGPALRVSQRARWTLNGFAGGYCKEVLKNGMLLEEPSEGPYKTLFYGLESFASLLKMGHLGQEQPVNWQTTSDGRRYISSRVAGRR
jgi:hypothetical protein